MDERTYLDKLIGEEGFKADINLPTSAYLYIAIAIFGSTLAAIMVSKALAK